MPYIKTLGILSNHFLQKKKSIAHRWKAGRMKKSHGNKVQSIRTRGANSFNMRQMCHIQKGLQKVNTEKSRLGKEIVKMCSCSWLYNCEQKCFFFCVKKKNKGLYGQRGRKHLKY